MKKANKKIYIVLTYTGTILSKIIRVYTRAEFCHVSLSLDKRLNKMYSFGRLNPYNPFTGGFVQEGINIGTFKRFKNTKAEIYCIEVTNEQYNKIRQELKKIRTNKNLYKFNRTGLFLSAINFKYTKKNRFYCAEFVKHLIDVADIDMKLPNTVKPIDFKKYNNLDLLYRGKLKNYN
ncbi:MAG: hypothetical protein IKL65_04640 [Bacilli bacterium]|nr:hypothetical protein [Bacilli bacterium]